MMFGWWLNSAAANREAFLAVDAGGEPIDSLKLAVRNLATNEESFALHAGDRKVSWRFAAAAVIALACVVLVLVTLTRDSPGGWQTYSTPVGGYERVSLPDGTRVELSTATQVRVHMGAYRRELVLERGEVFLEIGNTASEQFTVRAADSTFETRRARFSLRAVGRRVEVSVMDGRLVLTSSKRATRAQLVANEVGIVEGSLFDVRPLTPTEELRAVAWRRGELVFADEPLQDVVAEFNRYNRTSLVLADPEIGDIRIGGSFASTDLDGFTHSIAVLLNVHASAPQVTPSGPVIYLYRDKMQITAGMK